MILCNIVPTCDHKTPTFEESIEYLPEPIANQFRVLIKRYNVLEVEHLSIDESFNECGHIYSTIYELDINKKYWIEQEYNLKLLVEHKVTKERLIKLFKV